MSRESLHALAHTLGYLGDRGYVTAEEFDRQPNHRHALRLAAQRMNVRAAFGLLTNGAGALHAPRHSRFTPLVFLAEADSEADAQEIHKSVWSQGLVPYLIVAVGERFWICQGFAYSSRDWNEHARKPAAPTTANVFAFDPATARDGPSGEIMDRLAARRLRTSVAWQDFSKAEEDYVDGRLLRALAELARAFGREAPHRKQLKRAVTNALIARLLYFYFLVDRGFITQERLDAWGLDAICLAEPADWPIEATRELFRRLDAVFNGSIFPMAPEHWAVIEASHVNDLRRVLRGGGELGGAGHLQYGFLDYDFASIRTETLSAIYEMFLRSEEADAGRKLGAYYTPPFLVDYLLDRVEDEQPLQDGVTVLDPAAGSGVFLVGAYRRIIEAELPLRQHCLPLDILHRLMTENIFGVELNGTACHVAAFSLYLTMLDYIEPTVAEAYMADPSAGRNTGGKRLFPAMLSSDMGASNIRIDDFFDVGAGVDGGVRIVVGNPPWVQLKKLGSDAALRYAKENTHTMPIGDEQAAELFAWKALREHLTPGGILGLLLPMKSLVNVSSDRFTAALRRSAEVIGVADLSHLRYILFRRLTKHLTSREGKSDRARQPAAALLLRKCEPRADHLLWVYRPLRSTQPLGLHGQLWTLFQDWTQVQWHTQTDLDERGWLRALTCSPVDRRILDYLDRTVDSGRFLRLGALQKQFGLAFKIEVDQNIDRWFVLGTDKRERTYWLRQLNLDDRGHLLVDTDTPSAVPLPAHQLAKAARSSRPFLQGNIVLMPRSCERADLVEQPVAFSFSMIGACFPTLAGRLLPEEHKVFLRALAAYMSTAFFRYLVFVEGRRMMIDRKQVELGTVRSLPWPFQGPGDRALRAFVEMAPEEREDAICDVFGISRSFRAVIDEFLAFRIKFRDGGTAPSATQPLRREADVAAYKHMLLEQIDAGKGNYRVVWQRIGEDAGSVVVQFKGYGVVPADPDQAAELALNAYREHSGSSLSQRRYLWHSPKRMESVLIKPLERLHWTRERAYADADAVTAAVMSGFDSESEIAA